MTKCKCLVPKYNHVKNNYYDCLRNKNTYYHYEMQKKNTLETCLQHGTPDHQFYTKRQCMPNPYLGKRIG